MSQFDWTMTHWEAQVRTELADTYNAEGIEHWLNGRRTGRWRGRNAYEMFRDGEGEIVLERARRVNL